MRVAFLSPLPPAKSGIADYSAAVLEHLDKSLEVEIFTAKPASFDASRFPRWQGDSFSPSHLLGLEQLATKP